MEGQERMKRGKEGRGEVEIERGDKGGKRREGREEREIGTEREKPVSVVNLADNQNRILFCLGMSVPI